MDDLTGSPPPRRIRPASIALLVLAALAAAFGLPPLIGWQRMGSERALSLSNARRISTGLLLYSQDWDYRLMPPAERLPTGAWRPWPLRARAYVSPDSTFSNPSNPVTPFHSRVNAPRDGYPIDASYALNGRFWGAFSPGPFPLENLELPEQTVLLMEAGPMSRLRYEGDPRGSLGVVIYGDTTDRIEGLIPYPSTHAKKMAVVAADGHGAVVTIEHYDQMLGLHDTLYGRVGANFYNWNGGFLNGQTDRPPRD